MIKFTTKKPELSVMFNGQGRVTFTCPKQKLELLDDLQEDKEYTVEVKEYRKKRSLDANAFCWVLIGKLSEKLHIPPNEVYRNAIKDIGGNWDIICVQEKAVDKFCKLWQERGLGWATDILDSKIDGCKNVVAYYGSSTYDSKQMSRLIEIIIDECKENGIDYETPTEIANLMSLWSEINGDRTNN